MKRIIIVFAGFLMFSSAFAQEVMSPELLWKLGQVGAIGITKDGKSIVYSVKKYNAAKNEGFKKEYLISVDGGEAVEIDGGTSLVQDKHYAPGGEYHIVTKSVKLEKVFGKDYYPELDKSDVMIYDDLMYRHWDTWKDG